jgi:hypothetical protein
MQYANIPKHKLFQDLTGMKFNMLLVIGFIGRIGSNNQWECLCDCGNKKIIAAGNLKNNHTTSCGCFHKEQTSKKSKTHGLTKSNEYQVWAGMKSRCSDLNNSKYGGRGIKVCERWINSFENFLNDMGFRPSKNHSIERIDVNGDYEPSNCKWATVEEQSWNKRNTRSTILDNQKKSLIEISKAFEIPKSLLVSRYAQGKRGNNLLKQKYAHFKLITFNGITDTCSGWAKRIGLKADTVSQRLRRNKWSVEKTLTTGVKK